VVCRGTLGVIIDCARDAGFIKLINSLARLASFRFHFILCEASGVLSWKPVLLQILKEDGR